MTPKEKLEFDRMVRRMGGAGDRHDASDELRAMLYKLAEVLGVDLDAAMQGKPARKSELGTKAPDGGEMPSKLGNDPAGGSQPSTTTGPKSRLQGK